MNIASEALISGLLRVAVGTVAAVLTYRIAIPPTSNHNLVANGRRFFAWTAAACVQAYFGKFVFSPSGDNLAILLVSILVFGGVAFLAGLAWAKYRSRNKIALQHIQAHEPSQQGLNSEAKAILSVRLAKGEITIPEFNLLIATLGSSAFESPVPAIAHGRVASDLPKKGRSLEDRQVIANKVILWGNSSRRGLFLFLTIIAFLPLCIRTPPSGWPGVGSLHFLGQWTELFVLVTITSCVFGFPFYCFVWIYTKRAPNSYAWCILFGAALYLAIELILSPKFTLMLGPTADAWGQI